MINRNVLENKKNTEGLSMIELLVTISILLSVVMVVLVLGDKSISQATLFSTQTQAVFLAKEGVEIVTDSDIEEMINKTYAGNYYWHADYNTGMGIVGEVECKNKLKINNGFYGHSATGDDSPFSRCIISEMDSNKLKITVNVYFNHKGEEQVITLYRIFYEE